MNELEKALLDCSDDALDYYLEVTKTDEIRKDILEIKKKSVLSTEAGVLRERIMDVLNNI